ncbi:hypothetical protein GCM10009802_56400 [Streptomyces synnematoformans]|uniref:ATP-binding protein n=1 Tax=Streptomyces synnematoformans TaxID=415721 RepID=A0ABP4KDY4_9ACTN
MAASRTDVSRVARVVGDLPGREDRCSLSSGYRISDRLVLITSHALEGTTALTADLGGDDIYRPVSCVWRDGDLDLALLRFDAAPATRAAPVRLGSVARGLETEVAARAVGHPRWAEVDRSSAETPDAVWRGRTAVRCAIRTADTEAPDMLRVRVEDAAPALPAYGESQWQGMSGAAVRTDGSGLVVAVVRDHVPAAGAGMLQVTALDRVDDEEWRALLDAEGVDPRPLPVLPDGWRRTRALEQHHVHLDRIRRTPRPLVPEKLRYVDPGDAGSPDRVLARLARLAGTPGLPAGLIVVGEPGSGKTRLCLETAERAEDTREWLVVHVTEAVSLTDVWDSVDGLAEQVLVVADDIDWIDAPGTTYGSVFQQAGGSGVRLAVLTTARRRRLRALDGGLLNPTKTFDTVDIRWDRPYHRAISEQMVRDLARDAVRQQDERLLVRLCAGSPAASQLCATYYDNQAREGRDLTGLVPRPDPEFSNWMRELLLGMGLPAVPPDGDPDPATTAVAQIAVHAPCPLRKALDFFAPGLDDPRREAGATKVRQFVADGLLYAQDDALRPVHDVYADSLLGHAVLEADQTTVHPRGLRRVLETGLADGRSLVRVATAVDRLRETLPADAGARFARVVEKWCAERIDALRALVLADDEGRGRELRTLLTRRTWRPVAVAELAEPWLREHHDKARARDTVLTAARHLPAATSRRYLFDWIYDHGHRPGAALAFHRALETGDLDPAVREWTTDQVVEWLSRHGHRINAGRPLQRLLDTSRNALPPGDPRTGQVLSWALRWLRRHGTRREASFVARPLVLRPELTGADLTWTARLLLDSVAPGDPPSATFALEAVLARHRLRGDLDRHVYEQALTDSFAWLEDDAGYGLRPAAAYLLKELVVPGLPGRDMLARAVQAAWIWLEPNAGRHLEVGKVLPGLLKNASKSTPGQHAAFTRDEQETLGRLAVDWLAAHGDSPRDTGSEVLGALLGTSLPDGDPERLERLAEKALAMLGDRHAPSVARSVLTPLLHKRYVDGDLRNRVVEATFAQLPPAPPSRHMAFPLTELLRRADLTGAEHERAMTGTLAWLDRYLRAPGAAGLLATALGSRRTTPADRARLAARAVRMLTPRTLVPERHGKDPWLTKALLRHRADIGTEWNRFVGRACDVIAGERQPREAVRALRLLLEGADRLDGPVLTRLHETCLDWCAVHDRTDRGLRLLIPVLESRASAPPVRRRAAQVTLRRLRPGAERNSATGKVLKTLLQDGDLPDADEVDRVLDLALDWLEAQSGDHSAVHPLLLQVARRLEHQPGSQRSGPRLLRTLEHTGAWLRDHPDAAPEQRAALEQHRLRITGLLDAGKG